MFRQHKTVIIRHGSAMRILLCMTVTVALTHRIERATIRADETPPLAKAPFNAEQAKEFQHQWARDIAKPLVCTNSIGMKMVLLPPGEFRQGASKEELDTITREIQQSKGGNAGAKRWSLDHIHPYEGLEHLVRLTKPFRMSAHEVTVGQHAVRPCSGRVVPDGFAQKRPADRPERTHDGQFHSGLSPHVQGFLPGPKTGIPDLQQASCPRTTADRRDQFSLREGSGVVFPYPKTVRPVRTPVHVATTNSCRPVPRARPLP